MVTKQTGFEKKLKRSVVFIVVAFTIFFNVSRRIVSGTGKGEFFMGKPDLFDGHLIFGYGTGFVGADDCGGSECFGSLKPA